MSTVLFLPILYILAAGWFLYNQLNAFRHATSSVSWPKTRGTIQYAQRQLFALDEYGNLTGIRVVYRYEVNNQEFEGKTVGFSPKFAASRRMLSTHKPGTRVTVFYHPQQPELAALQRGTSRGNYLMLSTAVILLILTIINLILQFQTI